MRIRSRSIRASIVVLLLPPMISLIALWLFAASLALTSAQKLLSTGAAYTEVGKPTEALVGELQRERKLSVVFLGSGRLDARPLVEQRGRTDAAVASFRRHASDVGTDDLANGETKIRLSELSGALERLASGREAIDAGQIDRPGTLRLFTGVVDAAYRVFGSLPGVEEYRVNKDARTVVALSRAREVFAQEDALLSGVAAAGRFTGPEPGQLAQLIGAQRVQYGDAVPELPAADREAYQRMFAGEAARQVRAMEDRLVAEARVGAPVPIDMTAWRAAYETLTTQLRQGEFTAGDGIIARGRPVGKAIMLRLVAAGVIGLVAVIVSLIVSVRVARSIVRRLGRLTDAARDLAEHRLPNVVERLRAGKTVDVAAEAPPLDLGGDEIGAVGRALRAVQHTAIDAAVQEAKLRSGLSNVFLNIARRSQTLLHRQLTLLDKMERRVNDPAELEDLFRVDHLATRMRRHAEDLVILAGSSPGRGWRQPVPLVDVVRGAVSEVEDYPRVVVTVPETALAGRAVADLIHLLAELIENATSFSPPHTRVSITGELVPNGVAVEIEDRGLGMTPDALAEANRRLAAEPEFDPANSARLGLLVVGILAARHSVRVTLRSSPYGGVTAIVLIPTSLVVEGSGAALGGGTSAPKAQPVLVAVPSGPGTLTAAPTAAAPAPTAAAPATGTAPATGAARAVKLVEAVKAVETAEPVEPVEAASDGLPRRQRKARTAAAAEPRDAASRTPAEIRKAMSALQEGTVRGRRDASEQPGDGEEDG
jgi:Nitrate and nitrite sensing/HAMP domain/Histidine kinase-, DNA gyrase B-, and HSP90-like ATPase